MKKIVLITGASTGIGRATALLLNENGYQVYATARRMDKMEDLKLLGIRVLSLDVSKEEQMVACVEKVYNEAGRIDILINNAGYGSYGSLEETSMDEARYQTEVNVFGLARLTQLVVPKMRESRSGHIINVSSVGGRGGEALGSWYHATKFAVEGLSESLWMELMPFNVKVTIIEPGPIITEWGGIAVENLKKVSGAGPYKKQADRAVKYLTKINDPKFGSNPLVIAQTIYTAIKSKSPKLRYPAGNGAKVSMFFAKHLGDKTKYKLSNMMLNNLAK